jgi:hypothetical protein
MTAETLHGGVFPEHLPASRRVSSDQAGPEDGEGGYRSRLSGSGREGVGEGGPGYRIPQVEFQSYLTAIA